MTQASVPCNKPANIVRQMIVDATEVAPNRIEYHTTKEMLELLGMETELKEKRFLDLRPK